MQNFATWYRGKSDVCISGGNIPFDPTTTQICYEDNSCDHAIACQQLLIRLCIAGVILSLILIHLVTICMLVALSAFVCRTCRCMILMINLID